MIDADTLNNNLATLALEPEDQANWLAFLQDDASALRRLESKELSGLPVEQVDADLIRITALSGLKGPQIYLIGKVFVERLVPNPDEITNWPLIIELLFQNNELASRKLTRILPILVGNAAFLEKRAKLRSSLSLEEWTELVKSGELLTSLFQALGLMQGNRQYGIARVKSYFKMADRLRIPTDFGNFQVSPEKPQVIVTTHSRFRREFYLPFRAAFEKSLYSLVSDTLVSTQQVNAQRIIMVKHLKRGTSVIIAADGKKGANKTLGRLFGNDVYLSDGFTWVARKSKREVVWAFAGCNPVGAGLSVFSRVIAGARTDETEYEVYRDRLVSAFFNAAEDAIINHPFDFGLIYPMRLGDPRRAS